MQAKIYLAKDSQGKLVCVKAFKPDIDCDLMNSAEDEYTVSRMLSASPHVVNIHSYERQKTLLVDGRPQTRDFLVLEYCSNSDLFEFVKKYVTRQNATGLVSSQGQGMIVRDLDNMRLACTPLV